MRQNKKTIKKIYNKCLRYIERDDSIALKKMLRENNLDTNGVLELIKLKDNKGNNLFHHCAKKGSARICGYLTDIMAKIPRSDVQDIVNAENRKGQTPLMKALPHVFGGTMQGGWWQKRPVSGYQYAATVQKLFNNIDNLGDGKRENIAFAKAKNNFPKNVSEFSAKLWSVQHVVINVMKEKAEADEMKRAE